MTLKMVDFMKKLFRKKDFSEETSMKTPLNRCLGTWHLTLFSIAQVCGAGLFVLTGTLVKSEAGPGSSVSYAIGAISALFTAMCYAEMCTLIPRAGSCYTYTYILLGELPAFFIGWTMVSDYIVSMSSIAKAFSGTINSLSGGAIVNFTRTHIFVMDNNGNHLEILDQTPDIIAFFFLILLLLITLTGAKSSLTLNGIITSIQIFLLCIIMLAAFYYGNINNWTQPHGYFPFGLVGVLKGAGITVYAYCGFDTLANATEEAKNPKKSIPIALFVSLSIVTFFYIFATMSLTFVTPYYLVDTASPFVQAFQRIDKNTLAWIAGIATLLATGASKISTMYSIPRILYALAKDGMLFQWIGYIWTKTQVPLGALLFGGFIAALLALFLSLKLLAEFTSFGILISYIFIGIDLILIRYNPNYLKQYEICCPRVPAAVSGEDSNIIIDSKIDKYESFHDNNNDNAAAASDVVEENNEITIINLRDVAYLLFIKKSYLDKMRNIKIFYIILAVHLFSIFIFSLVLDFMIIVNYKHAIPLGLSLTFLITSAIVMFATLGLLSLYKPVEFYDSYTAPYMPVTPFMTIVVNFILLFQLSVETWIRGLIWTVIGIVIYFSYSFSHSQQNKTKQDQIKLLDQ